VRMYPGYVDDPRTYLEMWSGFEYTAQDSDARKDVVLTILYFVEEDAVVDASPVLRNEGQ